MTRAVIFDMFETLITHYDTPLYFGAQMAQDAGIPEKVFQALWRPTEQDRTMGNITFEEVIEKILRENQCYSNELLEKIVNRRIQTKEACFKHLHPGILPMLSQLKEKGILIGLISNCFSEEAEVVRRSVLFPYFDAVYLSYEQKVAKPDKEIFRRCMDDLEVSAEECVYVGDGGSLELETAKELGMNALQAVWYLKEGSSQPSQRKHDFIHMENPLDILNCIITEDK